MRRAFALALAATVAVTLVPAARAGEVTVFAAASLKTALDAAAADWQAATGNHATIAYAGSSTLARQIEQGAPAGLFLSADEAWMDALVGKGLIDPASRHDLLGNALVLVGAKGSAPLDLATLPARLGDGRLAMAMVDSVPAGKYGKASLTALHLWDAVSPKVAQTADVRAALALVATGAAPFGVVYATDAAAEPRVSVVATFPGDSHPPILYPAAVLKGASPAAAAFLAFLSGPEATAEFRKQGFTVLAQ